MQIHEITSTTTNEGILKGVKSFVSNVPKTAARIGNAANKTINDLGTVASKVGSGIGSVAKDAFTQGAFRYAAGQTGVNLAPYFADDDKNVVTVSDAKGQRHAYVKKGDKWYNSVDNKEQDAVMNAYLDAEAKKQTAEKKSKSKSKSIGPAPGSLSGWQSGPAASKKAATGGQYSEPIQVGSTVKDAYVKGPQGWVSAKNKYIPAPQNMIPMLDQILAAQGQKE